MNAAIDFKSLDENTPIGKLQEHENNFSKLQELEEQGFSRDIQKNTLKRSKQEIGDTSGNYAEDLISEVLRG